MPLLYGPSTISIASGLTQLNAPIDPGPVPEPYTLNFNAVAFGRILGILRLPHVHMVTIDGEPREACLVDLLDHVLRAILRAFDFLLDPVLLVYPLCEFGLRINKLDHLVGLSGPIDKLPLEEQTIRVLWTVVLVMGQSSVEFSDVRTDAFWDCRFGAGATELLLAELKKLDRVSHLLVNGVFLSTELLQVLIVVQRAGLVTTAQVTIQ